MSLHSTSGGAADTFGGAIALAFSAISIWAVVCVSRITFQAVTQLLVAFSTSPPPSFFTNILLSGLAGAFAGIAIVVARGWPRKLGRFEKAFIPALFQKDLAKLELDSVCVGRVLVGTIIGFIIGGLSGASGVISFPQFFSNSTNQIFTEAAYPVVAFVGGGFGGPGGTGFLSIAFLIIVVLIMAILIGCVTGVLGQLILWGIAGSAKGAVKEYVTHILEEKTKPVARE